MNKFKASKLIKLEPRLIKKLHELLFKILTSTNSKSVEFEIIYISV